MEIGTAIFLSAVLLSVVMLYGYTRDRVRWGRFFKWMLIIAVGSGILAVGGYYMYEFWSSRPIVANTLADVNLGDSVREVIFEKGEPSDKCYWDKDTRQVVGVSYKLYNRTIVIWFLRESAVTIRMLGSFSSYDNELQASSYMNEDDIIGRWGVPTKITEKEIGKKTLIYENYNVSFELAYNKIDKINVRHAKKTDEWFEEGKKRGVLYCVEAESGETKEMKFE